MLKRLACLLFFVLAMIVITAIAIKLGPLANPTTVGFCYLIVVVLSAVFAGLAVSIPVSVLATLFFNYFFFEPVGTFRINEFHNWVAVIAFLFTSIVISRLTASARENARNSQLLDSSFERCKNFGDWILSVPRDLLTLSEIAEAAVRKLKLDYCSIHVYAEGKWHHFSGTSVDTDVSQHITNHLRLHQDHPTEVEELAEEQALGVRYLPIMTGSDSLAVIAVKAKQFAPQAMNVTASMIGILLCQTLNQPHKGIL